MQSAKILQQKIQNKQLTIGAMAIQHLWPGLIEMAVRAGLDYLIICQEHLTPSPEVVAHCCAIGRILDFPIIIRTQAELSLLRLAVDLGPCGLMVPCIESTETLDMVQSAVYLPPRGTRRPGGPSNYWLSRYNYEDIKTGVEDDLIILPQIENKAGLKNVDEIAAHPLTTALAIGPYDLSADLGVCWDAEHPVLMEAIAKIRSAGNTAGKNTWIFGDGAKMVQEGFTFICTAETSSLLESSLSHMVKAIKNSSTEESI